MKTPIDILTDLKINSKKEDDDPEKMDFLMKAIKAFRSSSSSNYGLTQEEIAKQRADSERLAKRVTPSSIIDVDKFMVENIPCEWVKPKFVHRHDIVILYCHGGGYTNGGLSYARILAAKFAQHIGLEVMTFEYRLAPENPYPAAIEDGLKVWDYLMLKGYGASSIILAGDSAGGNLALEICLRLKEAERMLPRAMVLMSPWTDMRLVNKSYEQYADKDPMLTYEYIETVRNAYATAEADFSSPNYSPLLADLSNMPPTLIQVGSNEILRDDSEKLAKRYSKLGSVNKLEVYSGCWHVFQQMPLHKATLAIESVRTFLEKYF